MLTMGYDPIVHPFDFIRHLLSRLRQEHGCVVDAYFQFARFVAQVVFPIPFEVAVVGICIEIVKESHAIEILLV